MLQFLAKKSNQASKAAPKAHEVGALIVKLRWMGLEQEADTLCHRLETESVAPHWPAEPEETD